MSLTIEQWERLCEVRKEMVKLFAEARKLIQASGDTHAYDRARHYWLGDMEDGLKNLDKAPLSCTMLETINAIEPYPEEEDDE